ncbi:hypothetical protein CY35_01G055100 [Sphagnum magellanicum]|jgi:hypothetical protein|nr:hypothetical protein CY35_01G055100 [Sphagnum magellanicum]
MAMIDVKRALVLLLLLPGLVAVAVADGDKAEEVSSAAKSKAAEQAQGTAASWIDWAKQKLHVVTDTTSKKSNENIKGAKGAANQAGNTASGITDIGRAKVAEVSAKLQEGYEYAKSTGNEAAAKAYVTAKAAIDKAYEAAGVASEKTAQSTDAARGKSQVAFESMKQKLEEQYEAAKEVVNEQLKAASKLASDVGEHAKHMAGSGDEEL